MYNNISRNCIIMIYRRVSLFYSGQKSVFPSDFDEVMKKKAILTFDLARLADVQQKQRVDACIKNLRILLEGDNRQLVSTTGILFHIVVHIMCCVVGFCYFCLKMI